MICHVHEGFRFGHHAQQKTTFILLMIKFCMILWLQTPSHHQNHGWNMLKLNRSWDVYLTTTVRPWNQLVIFGFLNHVLLEWWLETRRDRISDMVQWPQDYMKDDHSNDKSHDIIIFFGGFGIDVPWCFTNHPTIDIISNRYLLFWWCETNPQ